MRGTCICSPPPSCRPGWPRSGNGSGRGSRWAGRSTTASPPTTSGASPKRSVRSCRAGLTREELATEIAAVLGARAGGANPVRMGRHAQAGRSQWSALFRARPGAHRDVHRPAQLAAGCPLGRRRLRCRTARDRVPVPRHVRAGQPRGLRRWWGTDAASARRIFAAHSDAMVQVEVDGRKTWLPAESADASSDEARGVLLLPGFDPYVVAPISARAYAIPMGTSTGCLVRPDGSHRCWSSTAWYAAHGHTRTPAAGSPSR
jgi:hypothetical protein